MMRISRQWCYLFVITASFGLVGLSHAQNDQAWIKKHLKNKTWEYLANQTSSTLVTAQRLLLQLNQAKDVAAKKRHPTRQLSHGDQETYHYSRSGQEVSVWVTGPDQKMIEERTYSEQRLVSILYADGTLKTFQYPPEQGDRQSSLACTIVVYADDQTRLFQYDGEGQLRQAFQANGDSIPLGNLMDFHTLNNLVDPACLRLGGTP